MPENHEISKLDNTFDVQAFGCGVKSLDDFIRESALSHQQTGLSKTWICHRQGSVSVDGYYTLTPHTVSKREFPQELVLDFPHYPVPGILLAKMAVRTELQKTGLSKFLMDSVFRNVISQSADVAYYALFVDALTDDLVPYYEKFGFIKFARIPRKLYFSLKTIKEAYEPRVR